MMAYGLHNDPSLKNDPNLGALEALAVGAVWAPGQLTAKWKEHGGAFYGSEPASEAGSYEVIANGTRFTYIDKYTGLKRVGYYDATTNGFTALTADESIIVNHYYPDDGEYYVGVVLKNSTYDK